jgi:hypothetical protein
MARVGQQRHRNIYIYIYIYMKFGRVFYTSVHQQVETICTDVNKP